MSDKIYPVILSGGAGTRLWPLSTTKCPKQFLEINSEKPLIVETALRFSSDGFQAPTIVSAQDYRFLVAQTLQDAGVSPLSILLEPVARNTTAAIAVACLKIIKNDPEAILLVVPSDHIIKDDGAFQDAIKRAHQSARDGHIITFGVVPDSPNIGYGYIKVGEKSKSNPAVCAIDKFVEKPELLIAQQMLDNGGYLWNSGIFLFKASSVLSEIQSHAPEILTHSNAALSGAKADMDFIRLDENSFKQIPAFAFDVAVMEQTDKGAVIPVDMGWSDVGSWAEIYNQFDGDSDRNICIGKGAAVDTKNSLIWSEDGIATSVIGMDDMLVVSTKDHVLVSKINDSAKIGSLAKKLQSNPTTDPQTAAKIYRPWGYYRSIDYGDSYQVKRLVIRPGARLSLQYHDHRSEHWVVVSGVATVTCDEKTFNLNENESTYIPAGHKHRLENKQKSPLILIEVQTGTILSEDDIVRISDDWGRIDTKDNH